ncbi:transposase [Escherichia coli]|nr:transposase [Escherichia coli]
MNGGGCGVAYVIIWNPTWQAGWMVHALKLAAGYDDISVVAKGMEQMLNTPGNVDLHRLMRFLGIKEKALPVVQCETA